MAAAPVLYAPPATAPPAASPSPAELEAAINRPITPYLVVQSLLDATADYCFYAAPDADYTQEGTITPEDPGDFFGINGGYGMDFICNLHGMDARSRLVRDGVQQAARAGATVAGMRARLYFAPDPPDWSPGSIPAPAIYDPWRSKRFVMPNLRIDFGCGEWVQLHVTGRTWPVTVGGEVRVLAGAAGDIVQGGGRFARTRGTLTMNGRLTKALGFAGNIVLRVVDQGNVLRRPGGWPALETAREFNDGAAYMVFRGEKTGPAVRTRVGEPRGLNQQLITPAVLRPLEFTCTAGEQERMRTAHRQGPVTAGLEASVFFNLSAPRADERSNVPFSTEEVYTFKDTRGETAGTVQAGVEDGISFDLRFPGRPNQPGVRFAGAGPVTGGAGAFDGAAGLLTVNSLIGISPHALSLIHVLQIVKGRAADRIPCHGRREE